MNISETISALEDKGVTVALEVGEHQFCDVMSNCPLAIQLRKMIGEANVPLTDLLDAYGRASEEANGGRRMPEVDFSAVPTITGKAQIIIGDKRVEVDISDYVKASVGNRLNAEMRRIDRDKESMVSLGRGLYSSSQNAIQEARKHTVIPQFTANFEDWTKYDCYVTQNNGRYAFIFKTEYHPEYLIQNGLRYKLAPSDEVGLRQLVYLVFDVSLDGKVYSAGLYDGSWQKFKHYHGSGTDCWGTIKWELPKPYGLKEVANLKRIAMGSLATINLSSLMNHTPNGWPHDNELKARARVLGQEGVVDSPAVVRIPEQERSIVPGWGARLTDAQTTAANPVFTREELEQIENARNPERQTAPWGRR